MSKLPAWVVAVPILISNAKRQQNLSDSEVRHASDGIRSGLMGRDRVRRIRMSSEYLGLFILSDAKPNVTVIMMSEPALARQLTPRGRSTRG